MHQYSMYMLPGMVSALDAAVEKIVSSFKHNHLWDDTVTVFSSGWYIVFGRVLGLSNFFFYLVREYLNFLRY